MDRRQMLRAMLGVAAASALPSEVWPFRKIFLPTYVEHQDFIFPAKPIDPPGLFSDPPCWVEFGKVTSITFEGIELPSSVLQMNIRRQFIKPSDYKYRLKEPHIFFESGKMFVKSLGS